MECSLNLQLQSRVGSLFMVSLFVDTPDGIGLARTIYIIFKNIIGVGGCNLLRLHGEGL